MKNAVKKWGSFCGVLAILLGGLAAFAWFTSRPVSLRAEELTPAETMEAYSGAELTLETTGYQLYLTFPISAMRGWSRGPRWTGREALVRCRADCPADGRGTGSPIRNTTLPGWDWKRSRGILFRDRYFCRPMENCPTDSTGSPSAIGTGVPTAPFKNRTIMSHMPSSA